MPEVSAFLRPALPFLVALILGLSLARVDLGDSLRATLTSWRLLGLLSGVALMVPGLALLYGAIGRAVWPEIAPSLVYLAAAPPIASAAGLCFMMGFNGRLALELTVIASLLTPILGPLAIALALPGDANVPGAGALAVRLGALVFGGLVIGILIRRLLGADRIARSGAAFDGLTALALLLFVLPLFDGVGALIFDAPVRTAAVFAFVLIFNLGVSLGLRRSLAWAGPATAGTLGVVNGNRNIAIYLAALPFDPTFVLFVALYQFPMYGTPLAMRLARLDRP